MRRFKGEFAHLSFNVCPIYTHDGASAKCSTNSHDNSAPTTTCSTAMSARPPITWGEEMGAVSSRTDSNSISTATPASAQHAPPPATILHQMFSICVARGIAAKLVLKSVCGQVVTSLYCSHHQPQHQQHGPIGSRAGNAQTTRGAE
jgi:hypothetical protein